jgi:chromosome segregation ATPase
MEAPLAQAGLIEIDPDGVATLTPNGRKLLRAARSGDLRAASDALSDARQDVKTKQRRVEEMRRKAEEYRENATEGEDKAKRRAADLVMDAQNAIERGKERATSLVARAEDYEKSIEEYEAREKVHEERADEIDNEIRDITNLLRNTTDPEQRKYMQEQINALEKQSASERAAAKTQHQNRLEAEQRFEELKGNIEDVIFDANERAAEYISRAEELLKGVSDAAEEWERRAKEYERRADELERSIAGGIQEPPSDSLLGKAWRAVQKAIFKEEKREVVIPRGNPLPPLQGDTVFTSDEEIAEAIRQWDADMEDAVGLLQPSQASLVEVAEQMARGNFEN